MTAREEILSRIKAACVNLAPPPPAPRNYRRRGDHPPGSSPLLDLLDERLQESGASSTVTTRRGIRRAIDQELLKLGVRGTTLLAPGLPESWAPSGFVDRNSLTAGDLEGFSAVVTACRAACAETGTLVLDGGPGQGRRALTLLPDVHVCVVEAAQVVQTVPELVSVVIGDRPVTFITGPSATSDIELSRVEGVHGPRHLVVIIVRS